MAATGKTPILIYGSTTATNQPSAGNLTNSSDGCEIAINVADKNLFFKDSTNTVNTVPIRQASASSNGWLSSTDWSTFNGKQAALVSGTNIKTVSGTSLLGSGDVGTIGVGYGGTGTSTAFTSGSIVFAGASGVYSQNNANFFWDNTNTRLGISTTSPAQKLDIRGSNTAIRIGSDTNDIGTLQFFNTNGSTVNASIVANLEGGYAGGNLSFYTKYISGTLTEKMRIDGSGNVGIGGLSAWSGVNGGALQVGTYSSMWSLSSTNNYLQFNSYFNGTNHIYTSSNPAAQLRIAESTWIFNQAASGTAGNAITWSEAMRINSSGGVSIGNTTDPGATNLSVTGTITGSSSATITGSLTNSVYTHETNSSQTAQKYVAEKVYSIYKDSGTTSYTICNITSAASNGGFYVEVVLSGQFADFDTLAPSVRTSSVSAYNAAENNLLAYNSSIIGSISFSSVSAGVVAVNVTSARSSRFNGTAYVRVIGGNLSQNSQGTPLGVYVS